MYASRIFQRNTTIGLINEDLTQFTSVHAATHVGNGRWDATANTNCIACNNDFHADGGYSIRFKRWKNTVRAATIVYPTYNLEIGDGMTIAPRATYTNLDATKHSFKVKMLMRSRANGRIVYSNEAVLPPINANTSYTTVSSTFATYTDDQSIEGRTGMFDLITSVEAIDDVPISTSTISTPDQWPFDDSTTTTFYSIRERSIPLREHFDEYSTSDGHALADATTWEVTGADIVEGDSLTFDPPAPRRTSGNGVGANKWLDPVLHLDRYDEHGFSYEGGGVGDTVTSMIYDLSTTEHAVLSFDYQRTGKMDFPLYWDEYILYGPEPAITYATGQLGREGDSLLVEMKDPDAAPLNTPGFAWHVIGAIDGGIEEADDRV